MPISLYSVTWPRVAWELHMLSLMIIESYSYYQYFIDMSRYEVSMIYRRNWRFGVSISLWGKPPLYYQPVINFHDVMRFQLWCHHIYISIKMTIAFYAFADISISAALILMKVGFLWVFQISLTFFNAIRYPAMNLITITPLFPPHV